MDLTKYDYVVVSTSAGKDSQTMLDQVTLLAEAQGVLDRVIAVHAKLGCMEWEGTEDLAREQAEACDVRFVVVSRIGTVSDGTYRGKNVKPLYAEGEVRGDLLDQVEHREEQLRARLRAELERGDIEAADKTAAVPPWFSPANRYCTADCKRGPIRGFITGLVEDWREARGLLRKGRGGEQCKVLECLGMRAEESPGRAKLETFRTRQDNSRARIDVWLPIHKFTEAQVWETIEESGLPHHWCYDLGADEGSSVRERVSQGMARLSCVFCLSGETEVVTRNGLYKIQDLAGGSHELLVPKKTPFGLSGDGVFRLAEVQAFGTQRLWRVNLRRGKQTKTVYATAEHRWLTEGRRLKRDKAGRSRGYDKTTIEATTQTLEPGTVLRRLMAHGPGGSKVVPFAVAQGFIYGDGSCGLSDRRPATLTIYDEGKDSAILPFFSQHEVLEITANGKPAKRIYGLPRLWKDPPPFDESRSFLLSWLAGYVAADGSVSESGSASLSSASYESLRLARGAFSVCGVDYGPISRQDRVGTGADETPLYKISFDSLGVPEWFFIIGEHRRRVEARRIRGYEKKLRWTVDSVGKTDRVEEVFCAVVPEVHAFALTEGLMTGNCCFATEDDLVRAATHPDNAEILARYEAIEQETGFTFKPEHDMAHIRRRVETGDVPVGPLSSAWGM